MRRDRRPGYVVFGGQKVSIPWPWVCTREGHEVALHSYARLHPERRYLFVIDGANALRAAIERVFGNRVQVQRCQLRKRHNVKRWRGGNQPLR